MKAAVLKQYGGPENIVIEEVVVDDLQPTQVCVQVQCSTIASGDRRIRSLDVPFGYRFLVRAMFGLIKPRKGVLGTELSGKVIAKGDDVHCFNIGDKVIVNTGVALGAHAQFVTVDKSALIVHQPDVLSDEKAAALCFGGITALDYLERRACLQPNESLLVIGGNGVVGSAAIQIARVLGARVVTSVRRPEQFARDLKRLGADEVLLSSTALQRQYDVILDCTGAYRTRELTRCLKPNGRLALIVSNNLFAGLCLPLIPLGQGKRIITGVASERVDYMERLVGLALQGRFSPAISATFPFEHISGAHVFADKGGELGSVVVSMSVPSIRENQREILRGSK
ncbi:quinone oxidoreductase family protein [Marinomonas mediterranea]|jgi:NADPH:quinone reductase and related Zn-dependent oxidoreductases|uniref:Alcohol dehydrogenase zinc-binding domain protein n=1 Tax=Marinomonas mediterranea (strain ATCC 700492 / JCM 21426 / NBRC 103028 / MMB-1) TaxID=717774 RepID=F2JYJ0_MARM1|nr:NAD(P)-dependent alcohol dehydrogenase [Marinomonas mediterranea]ADZ93119.1 Alcohol dehydrogenase zinc-binding domain protein [Marinomonas mediterranea MMB-1]WCN19128.1 zinc-binding dehydrogenase [Marinomonas mediterranea MMB-1]